MTEAAIKGKVDPLIGIKENVLLGKLIPAGTGMKEYRSVKLDTDAEIRRAKEEEERRRLEEEAAEEEKEKEAEVVAEEDTNVAFSEEQNNAEETITVTEE